MAFKECLYLRNYKAAPEEKKEEDDDFDEEDEPKTGERPLRVSNLAQLACTMNKKANEKVAENRDRISRDFGRIFFGSHSSFFSNLNVWQVFDPVKNSETPFCAGFDIA